VRLSAEPGANRVRPDVVDGAAELLVVPDLAGVEPALEQVAGAVVPLVEPLRVDTVQPVHEPGHRVAGAFEDGVEVVRHHAERRARELVLERQTPQ